MAQDRRPLHVRLDSIARDIADIKGTLGVAVGHWAGVGSRVTILEADVEHMKGLRSARVARRRTKKV